MVEEHKTNSKYEVLRILGEALYDHQDVRKASKNRVRSLIRQKLLDLGFIAEEKMEDEEKSKGNKYDDKKLASLMKKALKSGKLNQEDHDFIMISLELADRETEIEKDYEKKLKPLVEGEPIWKNWLKFVNGISTRNATRLLKWYGYCDRFDTISKLWAYTGLALVCPDCTEKITNDSGKQETIMVMVESKKEGAYCPKCGAKGIAPKRRKGINLPYNLKIKTDMIGVLGDNLMKANKGYKKIYDVYKERILTRGCCNNPKCKGKPGHAHRMAIRKMVKIFLQHYWLQTRTIKKLEISQPWIIGKKRDNGGNHTNYIKPIFDKKPEIL